MEKEDVPMDVESPAKRKRPDQSASPNKKKKKKGESGATRPQKQVHLLRLVKNSRQRVEPVVIDSEHNPTRVKWDYTQSTAKAGPSKNMSAQLSAMEALRKSRVWVDDSTGFHRLFDHVGVFSSVRVGVADPDNDEYVPMLVLRWRPDAQFSEAAYDGKLVVPVKALWSSKKIHELIASSGAHMQTLKDIDAKDRSGLGIQVALARLHHEAEGKFGVGGLPTMEMLKKYGFVVKSVRGSGAGRQQVLLPFTDVRCLEETVVYAANRLHIGRPIEVHEIKSAAKLSTSRREPSRTPHISGVVSSNGHTEYGSAPLPPEPVFNVPGGDTYFDKLQFLENMIVTRLSNNENHAFVKELTNKLKDRGLYDTHHVVPEDLAEFREKTAGNPGKYYPKFMDVYKLEDLDATIPAQVLQETISDILDQYTAKCGGVGPGIENGTRYFDLGLCTAREMDPLLTAAIEKLVSIVQPPPLSDVAHEHPPPALPHSRASVIRQLAEIHANVSVVADVPGVCVVQGVFSDDAHETEQDNYFNGFSAICQYRSAGELCCATHTKMIGRIKVLQWGGGSFTHGGGTKYTATPSTNARGFSHVKPFEKAPSWTAPVTKYIAELGLLQDLAPPNHITAAFISAESSRVNNMLCTARAASARNGPAVISGTVDLPEDPQTNYTLLFTAFASVTAHFAPKILDEQDKPRERKWIRVKVPPWSLLLVEDEALTYWDNAVVSKALKVGDTKPSKDDYTAKSNSLLMYRSF